MTVPQMGQMGFHKRTEYNKRILKICENVADINADGWKNYGLVKGNYVIVKGSVAGPTKRLIRMRHAIRNPDKMGEPDVSNKIIR